MFIYFSENEPESSSELPAQKDALDDMFFDYQEFEQSSLDPETSKKTSNDSRSQKSPSTQNKHEQLPGTKVESQIHSAAII